MKTEKEIHKFYAKKILPDLKHLELKRSKIHRVLIILMGVTVASSVLSLVIVHLVVGDWTQGAGGAILIPPVVFLFCYAFLTRHYKKQVTQNVVSRLVKFLMPNLHYEPYHKIPMETFLLAGLFTQKLSEYHGQNKVSGTIGKTVITFSEIQAVTKGHKSEDTFFKGLFFVADFNKPFRTRTVVLPDIAENMLGAFGQTLQSLNLNQPSLVKLEDPEFERDFVVYGEDQIEARYILSPALMERILAYRKKYDKCIRLSFTGSRVFIAIHASYPLFYPKVSVSLFDYDQIREYCQILQMALDVVDVLNLNTRIWTKE